MLREISYRSSEGVRSSDFVPISGILARDRPNEYFLNNGDGSGTDN